MVAVFLGCMRPDLDGCGLIDLPAKHHSALTLSVRRIISMGMNDQTIPQKLLSSDERARRVMRGIVDGYLGSGQPVGSRVLSKNSDLGVSAATVRNVMADLEDAGLIFAPHTSAGRLPTELGLRLFVDGLMEVGNLSREDRSSIEAMSAGAGRSMDQVLSEATSALAGLTQSAALVVTPKVEASIRHIEFVPLSPGKALVVLVFDGGQVENRLIDVPAGLPLDGLSKAGNFLSARAQGKTLRESMSLVTTEIEAQRAELDALTAKLVEAGLASSIGGEGGEGSLILRGQSELLGSVQGQEDVDRLRRLFAALETKEIVQKLAGQANDAPGVQIFIGSQSELFGLSGWSMIMAPYKDKSADGEGQVIGAVGVIGPMHINYGRVIPMVDYTAQVVANALT